MKGKKKITDQVMAANRANANAAHRLRWREHFQPQGPDEEFLVDEIAISWWKLRITERLESRELPRRQ